MSNDLATEAAPSYEVLKCVQCDDFSPSEAIQVVLHCPTPYRKTKREEGKKLRTITAKTPTHMSVMLPRPVPPEAAFGYVSVPEAVGSVREIGMESAGEGFSGETNHAQRRQTGRSLMAEPLPPVTTVTVTRAFPGQDTTAITGVCAHGRLMPNNRLGFVQFGQGVRNTTDAITVFGYVGRFASAQEEYMTQTATVPISVYSRSEGLFLLGFRPDGTCITSQPELDSAVDEADRWLGVRRTWLRKVLLPEDTIQAAAYIDLNVVEEATPPESKARAAAARNGEVILAKLGKMTREEVREELAKAVSFMQGSDGFLFRATAEDVCVRLYWSMTNCVRDRGGIPMKLSAGQGKASIPWSPADDGLRVFWPYEKYARPFKYLHDSRKITWNQDAKMLGKITAVFLTRGQVKVLGFRDVYVDAIVRDMYAIARAKQSQVQIAMPEVGIIVAPEGDVWIVDYIRLSSVDGSIVDVSTTAGRDAFGRYRIAPGTASLLASDRP
jgi:hypothetical protein